MIRINLLPHREEKRRARRNQFFALIGLIAVLAGLIVFLGYSIIGGYISIQQDKNDFLKVEITKLDKQITQIKSIREEISRLLAKKQVVESLQQDRGRAVSFFNELAKQMPEGVALKSFKQEALKISLTGVAQNNSRVSELMRNLSTSTAFDQPKLVETKAVTVDKRKVQEFSMTVSVRVAKTEDGKPQSPAADASKPQSGGGK